MPAATAPSRVKAPEGSILNPKRPAAVNLRTRTGWYLAPNIFRALSDAAPRQVQANTGLPMAAYMYGQDAEGRTYSDMLFIGGGQGASAQGDGKNGLLWPTSAANTSIELFEARVPVLVLEKTFVTDTGGAGKHRGGLGQRVKVRKLHDDGLTTLITVYPEGVGNPIAGLFGGKAGGEASGRVLDTEGNEVLNCGTGMLVQIDRDTQVVEIVLAGGSGFGEPAERDPAVLARDVQRGLVSEEGAARDYAVAPVAATA
jgi:5-oxoprolinase (ATP-hydrolysing)